MAAPQKKATVPSTQKYLDIQEIRDDIIILKDGTIRALLLVSSLNFSLKSYDEQEAIIQGYVQFLNSLNFPLQIVIQSRKLDIDEYLARIKTVEKNQKNELLKIQTADYRRFITELVKIGEIMSKKFFVAVPYSPFTRKSKGKGFFTRFQEALAPTAIVRLQQKKFDKFKTELERRVSFVIDGLNSIGLKSVWLDTQSLIELFYNIYNPTTYDQQKMTEIGKLGLEIE